MSDQRELILGRLLKIMEGIAGIKTVARMVDTMPEESRPCMVLLDGDETRADGSAGYNMQPVIITLSPMISIGVSAISDDVGAEVNLFRARLLPAILGDSTLASLLSDGRITYDGLASKLSPGNLMASDMQLSFSVNYALKPSSM